MPELAGSVARHRLLILGAALLFSTGGAAIKACSLSAWQVTSFRSGVAALALLIVLPESRRWWEPRLLAVGLAYALTMVLFVTANKLTTAANTIFLQSTAPIYLLLFGSRLLGETVRRADLVFTATLAAGMALFFVGGEPSHATAPDPFSGNLLGVLSGATWALTILGLRWLGRGGEGRSAAAAVVAGNLIAFLGCLPLALPVSAAPPATDWMIVVYLGVFQIGLAYACLTRGVRALPALETTLLLLVEPVLNALWAWMVHGERPGNWSLAGCTLILIATLLRTLRGRA